MELTRKRYSKRVEWYTTMDVPAPYYWFNSQPFGDTKGVNEKKTTCTREAIPGAYPSYLGRIECWIVSNRFK